MTLKINELIESANLIYKSNFPNTTYFERAIFISWYCAIGDCSFCYMSTQQSKISEPKRARRKIEGILADAFLCRKLGWRIEFISGGVESYTTEELEVLLNYINEIYHEKLWLNIGILDKSRLLRLKPYLLGITGTVETVNPLLHKQVCPSKPIKPIEYMFRVCEEIGLKKAITIIIGLGETIDDFPLLEDFIRMHNVDRITFYALNPIKGTVFEANNGPEIEYFLEWIAMTRISFPKLDIIAGLWVNKIEHISLVLKAGANALTKFPAIKLFGSEYCKMFEERAKSERELIGTLTTMPKIDLKEIDEMKIEDSLKVRVKEKVIEFLEIAKRNNTLKLRVISPDIDLYT